MVTSMVNLRVAATFLSCLLFLPLAAAQVSRSSKRGLIYISSEPSSEDSTWASSSSDLTWYYNYGATTTSDLDSSPLQFVPMLFGAPSDPSDTTFLDAVGNQLTAGVNISYVLGFNEPDGDQSTGGSSVPADQAAQIWQQQMNPLKSRGIKIGGPAMTGAPSGFTWLEAFFSACNNNCTVDFLPVHWYGDFQGFASHLGQMRAAYPNMTLWVTEFADPNVALSDTQSAYNQSSQYMDRLSFVQRYSYFGSFRSTASNVGPNVAMLDGNGQLTDIGSWYLGGSATGVIPNYGFRPKAPAAWVWAALMLWTWCSG